MNYYRIVSPFEHEVIRRAGYAGFPPYLSLCRIFEAKDDEGAISLTSSMQTNAKDVRYLLRAPIRASYFGLFVPTISGSNRIWTEYIIHDCYFGGMNPAFEGKIEKVAILRPKKAKFCVQCGSQVSEKNISFPFCTRYCAMRNSGETPARALLCAYNDKPEIKINPNRGE